mmetsp:Transcript_95221/g.293686  ORF Transcript_95221/g.293686 Transcript_95221/m.293686 type:complete len:380 (+) Transcript_95221:60-1199(+)
MRVLVLLFAVVTVLIDRFAAAATAETGQHHRHRHRQRHIRNHRDHHHHRRHGRQSGDRADRRVAEGNSTEATTHTFVAANGTAANQTATTKSEGRNAAAQAERRILDKMRVLERQLTAKANDAPRMSVVAQRTLEVNGPLPPDFEQLFSAAVAEATNSDAADVKVVQTKRRADGAYHLLFQASPKVAEEVQDQAADPDSKLAAGDLHDFLVAKEATATTPAASALEDEEAKPTPEAPGSEEGDRGQDNEDAQDAKASPISQADVPMQRGLDMDAQMPYGELEPFGREDTAQELTERSISESNQMVDQLERAEVAEEKRAVFRALTRLRGAALTAFDGIARAQTGTIDEYNKLHKWRAMHPLNHLADEEADVSKWAFPDF